jgi:hypothetical protein
MFWLIGDGVQRHEWTGAGPASRRRYRSLRKRRKRMTRRAPLRR